MTTFVHASLTASATSTRAAFVIPRSSASVSTALRMPSISRASAGTRRTSATSDGAAASQGAVRSPAWPAQPTSRCRPVSTLVEAREFGAELRVLLPQRCGTPAHARKRLREPVDRERVLCARHAHTGGFTGVAIGPPARIGRLGERNVWPHMGLPPDPFGGLARASWAVREKCLVKFGGSAQRFEDKL